MKTADKFKGNILDKEIELVLAEFAVGVVGATLESLMERVDDETGSKISEVISGEDFSMLVLGKIKEI